MSPLQDRIERLEDWRVVSERNAERVLGRLEAVARSVEHHARAIERMGTGLEALLDERREEAAVRASWSRLRRGAYAAGSLVIALAGVLIGRAT